MPEGPTYLLERWIGRGVVLQLKDARQIRGKLLGVDEHMNLVLDEAHETTAESTRTLGRVVVRGSNVVSLNAPPSPAGSPT